MSTSPDLFLAQIAPVGFLGGLCRLENQELAALSSQLAEAFELSHVMNDGSPPQLFLSILAMCNHVQLLRRLEPCAPDSQKRRSRLQVIGRGLKRGSRQVPSGATE